MINIKKFTILVAFLFNMSGAASAQTEIAKIEFDHQTTLKNQEISLGKIKVIINYKPENSQESQDNLHYRIYYNGQEKVEQATSTFNTGSIFLQDLDNDSNPEAIVQTYTGGAHCCTNFEVYTWQNSQFNKIETGSLDGYGGEWRDLNKDNKIELIAANNSFLYKFSAYALSFPPSLILSFNNNEFKDVTRQYPDKLRSVATKMYQSLQDMKKQGNLDVNGVLAGYVAQKILLGEYQQGWDFMLNNYDSTSDWGLEIYQGDRMIGKYPDFPTALKAFLIEQGYLDKNGNPIN
jgi:hypothetical protein